MKQKPESLTFDRFRELLDAFWGGHESDRYISRSISVVGKESNILQKVVNEKRIMQLEDYRIGIVASGQGRVYINLIEHELSPDTLVFLTPGTIVQPLWINHDFTLKGMVLSIDTLHMAVGNQLPGFLNGERMAGLIAATGDQSDFLGTLFMSLLRSLRQQGASMKVVYALVAAILHAYDDLFQKQKLTQISQTTRERAIFDKFIYLVNTHGKHEHRLSFYADKLCLTERYLGVVVKQASGVTAKEWIDRAIMAAAQVMLKYSDLPIVEIAMRLNFPNPSFFNKFFRRMKGCTPMEFRNG
ncbi:AraC family transcriptional regulator [Prevotella sp.]|uniref:AraC family transcriptional regulator n=1 Tax=Prevotella sp. TaxID=59823 RepID=UPI002F955F76